MSAQSDHNPDALEMLLGRRQFFLGPEHLPYVPAWKRLSVDDTYRLTVHPDLDVYQATDGNKSITLLGYILDPRHPRAANSDVIDTLIRRLDGCEALWPYTSDFGGRWILVVHDGRDTILFHDAAGLRSVYYARDPASNTTVCASQPIEIAERLKLAKDPEGRSFLQSREDDDCEVYWMPGDTSPYEDVKCLLPNHQLDVRAGRARRYWPDTDVPRRAPADAVAESARLLRGLMTSARRRFGLALSMTAGWDSRLMLAVSRDVAPDLYSFTLAYPGSEHSRDARIPAALLKRLGLEHEIVRYPTHVDAGFKDVYRHNAAAQRTEYCADAQALYDRYPRGRVCITGDVGEIVKCHYRLAAIGPDGVSAQDLADLCGFAPHPFLARAFQNWLSSAACRNVHLLDLFAWEQFAGRKQALIRAQYDIVHESFAPLNCRSLLVTMLSAEENYRRPPEHRLFLDLIRQFWSDVLCVPINPGEQARLRRAVRRTLEALGVYKLVPERLKEAGRRVILR